MDEFLYRRGEYKLSIYANSWKDANEAMAHLDKINYYPNLGVWNTETQTPEYPRTFNKVNSQGLRYVNPHVGYVDEDEEYY